ncbi:MAG TPA: BON domain-containing protein [Terriglobia bacterium]|nr:BON domain-containing protein [Terriglobia bacterium]
MIRKLNILLVALTVVLAAGLAHANSMDLSHQVHHELAMLPYTTIWDWVEADLQADGSVVLRGDVRKASIKSDAEFRVRRIEGVKSVTNEIRVLPVSQFDDQVRLGVYRSLFNSNSTLSGYALGANPSIHIIVDNGHVTLKGVVGNAMDKQVAGMKANGVFGVFSVENDLEIEHS